MNQIRLLLVCHLICGLAILLSSSPTALGQQAPARSAEERSSLLAERDTKAKKAIALANTGEFEKASVLLDEVFKIEQSIFGAAHEELLGTFDYQAKVASAAGDWSRAIEFRKRARKMGKALYPQDNYRLRDLEWSVKEASDKLTRTDEQRRQLRQADALSRRVVLLYRRRKSAEAIDLAKQAIELKIETLGKEHPSYATSLNNLAMLYKSMGDYARAEPLYVEAKKICEKTLGKEHPSYAASLNNLAVLHASVGDYARAEPLHVEAKTIREKTIGIEHPDYAASLNDLAMLHASMGDYARAEPLFAEAKTIKEKSLGTEHPSFATSLNNLAMLYKSMGDYARAEPLLVEAKTIREKTLGKEHPDYAQSLNNLAMLHESMGVLCAS